MTPPEIGTRLKRTGLVISAILFIAGLAACGEYTPEARTYEVRGVYLGTAFGDEAIVVDHEEIPGYMDAMRMTLRIIDPSEVSELEVGDSIAFRLVVQESTTYIDHVWRLSPASVHDSSATSDRAADSPLIPAPGE